MCCSIMVWMNFKIVLSEGERKFVHRLPLRGREDKYLKRETKRRESKVKQSKASPEASKKHVKHLSSPPALVWEAEEGPQLTYKGIRLLEHTRKPPNPCKGDKPTRRARTGKAVQQRAT